jgi:hypothetical protein
MSNIKQTIIAAAVAVTFTTTAQADGLSDSLPLGKSLAAGQELPLPLGISANVFFMEQDMTAQSIKINTPSLPINLATGQLDPSLPLANWFPPLRGLPVKSKKIESRATSTTAKLDAWLLPFLNVYAVAGYVDGETTASGIYLDESKLTQNKLTQMLPPQTSSQVVNGLLSNLDPLRKLVPDSFSVPYNGSVYGVGATLAAGYNQFFASVDANYTEADLDIGDSSIEAFVISPRVGITGELGGLSGSLYVGAMYQDVDENQNGTVNLSGQQVGYDVISQAEDEWNYLVGANLKASESWNYGIEVGFSERTHVMATLNYRF